MLLGALSKMAGALLEPKAATGNSITRRSQGPLQLLVTRRWTFRPDEQYPQAGRA